MVGLVLGFYSVYILSGCLFGLRVKIFDDETYRYLC